MTDLPKYRFMPWSRRGLVAHTKQPDNGGDLPARAPLNVAITVSNAAVPPVDLRLYGPGDVSGIDPRVIVRTDPRPHSTDSEPNYLAAIEFDLPDLPWMFTPASPGQDQRLRPWCVLVVLERSKVGTPKVDRGAPLPTIRVPAEHVRAELPELAESWAWAHVQVLSDSSVATTLAGEMTSKPHLSVARLLCPRRLEPGKHYVACLVPAFDLGVQRGLGATPAAAAAKPAWDVRPTREDVPVVLPVYYHWEFGTGPAGDFESLARRLTPTKAPAELGFQSMYIGEPRGGLASVDPAAPAAYTRMEGVLRAPKASASALADIPAPLQTGLQTAVNAPAVLAGDNTPGAAIAPPLYGGWPLCRHRLDGAPAWLRELNLDPRMRAAAGLGAEVVRKNQEAFMQACWEQVGDVIAANALLNRSRFAQEALRCMYERHYLRMSAERLLQVTAPVHARTRLGPFTIRGSIARASLPDAGVDVALRRMLSPQRPLLKRAARRTAGLATAGSRSVRLNLVGNLAAGILAVDPTRFVPDGLTRVALLDRAVTDADVDLAPAGIPVRVPRIEHLKVVAHAAAIRNAANQPAPVLLARTDLAQKGIVGVPLVVPPQNQMSSIVGWPNNNMTPAAFIQLILALRYQAAFTAMANAARIGAAEAQPVFKSFDTQSARTTLTQRIDPRVNVPERVRNMLAVPADAGLKMSNQQDRVMAAPELAAAMYTYLADLDSQRFLPGVGQLPAESITLVETNPRFIEAFMVGLNHEMNRELLWRGYPTDQRGTVLARFWDWSDGSPDLGAPIHQWTGGSLGAHVRGAGAGGQIVLLLRGQLLRRYPNTMIYAWRAVGGALKQNPGPGDILEPVFRGQFAPDVSFAGFSLRDVDLASDDGWFFVLQEQPTEPRFGLDEPPSTGITALTRWSDATWQHTNVLPGAHLVLDNSPLKNKTLEGVSFNKNSAHLARITIQRPMRVAIAGKRMVQG